MRTFKKILGYVILTAAALTFIYPFLWMISASFKPESEIGSLSLIPKNFTLAGYGGGVYPDPNPQGLVQLGICLGYIDRLRPHIQLHGGLRSGPAQVYRT